MVSLLYCYDALCGWCYGFSATIQKLHDHYADRIPFDVLAGGMVMPDNTQPIAVMSKYIGDAYKNVEALSGVKFGEDYLWHIRNPEESDWALNSEMPAVALAIFKEAHPERALEAAAAIQYGHMYEGRDLTDREAYRHLLPQFGLEPEDFYTKLASEEYLDKAYYDFALCKQLGVSGYPTLLMQVSDSKFYLLSQGFTDFETLSARIEKVLAEETGQA